MKILLRNNNEKDWKVVEVAGYDAEDELQLLLAQSPSIISLDEVLENAPPLVVAVRELGLPGSGYTDILAFNDRGDIVVIECKLAANPEIKRKVIAQVLEYGAYLWNMSYEDLNKRIFERTNKNLVDLVADSLGDPDWDQEAFRQNIEDNLSTGSFVLVVAVDDMNEELMRTMRFLSVCGNPKFHFTVLETKRFQRNDTEILVPHLHGIFSRSNTKQTRRGRWTESEFFENLEGEFSPEIQIIYKEIYDWAVSKADKIWFGNGSVNGSVTFHYLLNGQTVSVFSIYTKGYLTVNFGYLYNQLDETIVNEFFKEITEITPFANFSSEYNRWPSVRIEDAFVNHPDYLENFKQIVEDLGEKIHQ